MKGTWAKLQTEAKISSSKVGIVLHIWRSEIFNTTFHECFTMKGVGLKEMREAKFMIVA